MKVSIPLNSTLSTDSHDNEIKDPVRGRDLLNKNQSYLYNNHLTNPRKQKIEAGSYITTNGDELKIERGSNVVRIKHEDTVIASVSALGIEDTSFLDVDDAIIHDGHLLTVQRTLDGFRVEKINLLTQAVSRKSVDGSVLDVRFVRNTDKIITRNNDNTVTLFTGIFDTLNSTVLNDSLFNGLENYLANFSGEFVAVEVNNKIYFGYNNPAGVEREEPDNTISIEIDKDMPNGWVLSNYLREKNKTLEPGVRYDIEMTIRENKIISGGGSSGVALHFSDGISQPKNLQIKLFLEENVIISGRGGKGGSITTYNPLDGENGTTAIVCASDIKIQGPPSAVIQGGGGGGAAINVLNVFGKYHKGGGGGGAGRPAGSGGQAGGAGDYDSGLDGTETKGGIGGEVTGNVAGHGGSGGNIATDGNAAYGTGNKVLTSSPGTAGNAILIINPAVCTIDSGITLKGEIRKQ